MAKLKLVQKEPLTENELRALVAAKSYTYADLMRRSNFSKEFIQQVESQVNPTKQKLRMRRPKDPRGQLVMSTPLNLSAEPQSSVLSRWDHTWEMRLIAFALGGTGSALNYQFARSLGHDVFASHLMGVVGIAIDTASVFLLMRAETLWEQKRRVVSLLSVAVWVFCSLMSLQAGISYMATNIVDSLQGREIVTQHRKALNSELAIVQSERGKIVEDRDPGVLEERIQIARGQIPPKSLVSSKDCTDVTISGSVCSELNQLRASKRTAERRIELDAKLSKLNEDIAALPPIAVKDPGADYMSRFTAGAVDPDSIEGFRVIGFALMPSMAGLLLMFARRVHK